MLLTATSQALGLKAKLFRGLADPSRLTILEALRAGPRCVGEIVAATGLSQPNASAHLACLHDCGLVTRRQEKRHVFYALADERVAGLLGLADEVLGNVARGIYECTRYARGEERNGPAADA